MRCRKIRATKNKQDQPEKEHVLVERRLNASSQFQTVRMILNKYYTVYSSQFFAYFSAQDWYLYWVGGTICPPGGTVDEEEGTVDCVQEYYHCNYCCDVCVGGAGK